MVASADDQADKPAQVMPLPLPDLTALAELIELRRQTIDDIKRITGIDEILPAQPSGYAATHPEMRGVFLHGYRQCGKSHAAAMARDYLAMLAKDAARLALTYETTSFWFDEGEQIERAEQNRIE